MVNERKPEKLNLTRKCKKATHAAKLSDKNGKTSKFQVGFELLNVQKNKTSNQQYEFSQALDIYEVTQQKIHEDIFKLYEIKTWGRGHTVIYPKLLEAVGF